MNNTESAIRRNMAIGREYCLDRAGRDIEAHRKGDFRLRLEQNGAPYTGEVTYALERIDFDFGSNLFMLGQYRSPDDEARYLELWKKLFNTAVVPLYWEGTEPRQGYLRYGKDSPNDVYRRPPVEQVVEYCRANGIAMKGHPLFWHEYIPLWLPEDWETLLPLIEKRFEEISRLFAEDIPVFDCVNEPGRIWDMCHEHRRDGYKMIAPPDGYLEQVFALGAKYFPGRELVLNEATGECLLQFKGSYGGFYQLVERLLREGCRIDRIGLQCHIRDSEEFANVFNAERFYGILDGYSRLGKPLVLSEIGLYAEDEDLQAEAAEQLYRICFSAEKMTGIFWWNLDDNGVLCDDRRDTPAENLPNSGLCRNGVPKAAYQVLDRLINREWTTKGSTASENGCAAFRGFYGRYRITAGGRTFTADFGKQKDREITLSL